VFTSPKGILKMTIVVKADPTDTSDQVIRKFKKKVQQEQLLTKIKEKEFYKKPSVLKKEKLAEIRRKRRKRS
jgi:small subunit ribosomal protein S21